ncbi:hypothetical protein DID88_000820 [Monilinia fructigena]|uniref:Methyltransferase domain-containing protein n=1 Tax=Monilinia fructigena TaxID=38457 RepID=A0A395IPA5_9HELO|nr:hypothetical protein DID88_000820 [Monilinia fructigena]
METIVQPEELEREQYLLIRRDEEEKDRLNYQSNYIKLIRHGHVLDPRIPKENVSRVADIAAGTGIWLREMAAELVEGGYNQPVEAVGFDISAVQFPKISPPGNNFDVVHVRLLVLAIPAEQIKHVVNNLVELLKPGGYLQWTDIPFKDGLCRRDLITIGNIDEDCLSFKSDTERMVKLVEEDGYSSDLVGLVKDLLQDLPLEDVHVTDNTNEAYLRPEIRGQTAEWQSRTMSLIKEMLLSRHGHSKEQAKIDADNYRKSILELGRRGMIFRSLISTLVARKKR